MKKSKSTKGALYGLSEYLPPQSGAKGTKGEIVAWEKHNLAPKEEGGEGLNRRRGGKLW